MCFGEPRQCAIRHTIPPAVLIPLALVAALSLAMAAHNAGMQGGIVRWRIWSFALIPAALIVLIMDFDLPQRGFIRVSHDGLTTLIPKLEADLAR